MTRTPSVEAISSSHPGDIVIELGDVVIELGVVACRSVDFAIHGWCGRHRSSRSRHPSMTRTPSPHVDDAMPPWRPRRGTTTISTTPVGDSAWPGAVETSPQLPKIEAIRQQRPLQIPRFRPARRLLMRLHPCPCDAASPRSSSPRSFLPRRTRPVGSRARPRPRSRRPRSPSRSRSRGRRAG